MNKALIKKILKYKNIFKKLIQHEYYSVIRKSSSTAKHAEIFISVLIHSLLYFLIAVLFTLPLSIIKNQGLNEGYEISTGFSIVTFAILLFILMIIRFLFFNIVSIDFKPYLILPIQKNEIATYLLWRSLFSLSNFIALIGAFIFSSSLYIFCTLTLSIIIFNYLFVLNKLLLFWRPFLAFAITIIVSLVFSLLLKPWINEILIVVFLFSLLIFTQISSRKILIYRMYFLTLK